MVKTVLKRLIPARVRAPMRRAYDAARDAILRPATLREAAGIHSRLVHYVEGRPTIVFFTPEAGVTLYLRTQAALARILRSQGCNVVFVRCFELLPRCPVKDMHLLAFDSKPALEQKVCLQCYRDSVRQLDEHGLDFVDLREIVGSSAQDRIDAAMVKVPGHGLDYEYDGINVGALAFYDFAISHKHPVDHSMSPEGRAAWEKYVRNAITAIEMVRGLITRFRPVALACFDEYAMMSAARLYARRHGAAVRMVSVAYHLNGDPQRPVALSNLTVVKDMQWRGEQWARWRGVPLPPNLVAAAADDVVHRLTSSGAHIYSPRKTLETSGLVARLNLDSARRVLIAYTSSRDEHDALLVNLHGLGIDPVPANDAFSDTFEWLHEVIAHVEASHDLQLIVRVHPRVGVTSRDNRVAAEYQRYRAEFSAGYGHCRFVWPEDPVSSFDLAEIADLALVSWSSIGLELARLGVPVLSGNHSMMTISPGEGFIEQASTREQYFSGISRLLAGRKDAAEQLRYCYRWYHLFNIACSIDLSDVIGRDGTVYAVESARHSTLVKDVLIGGAQALTRNLAELASASLPSSKREENEALRRQVGRLVEFLCTGRDPVQPVELQLCEHSHMVGPQHSGRLSVRDDRVVFDDGDRMWERKSRMVARLGAIFASLSSVP